MGQQAASLRQEWDAAMASGEPRKIQEAEAGLRRLAGIQEVYRQARGDDTLEKFGTVDYSLPPHIRNYMVTSRLKKRWDASEQAAKDAGLDQLISMWNEEVIKPYRERNEEPLGNWKIAQKTGDTEEMLRLQKLMTPLEINPEIKGNMSQLAVQVDNAMKQASNGRYRLWNHPRLKDMTNWLNREGAYAIEGAPTMTLGPLGRAAAAVEEGTEAYTDLALNLAYSAQAGLAKLTGGMIPEPPKNYLRDPETGALYLNQARPHPGIREIISIARGVIAGRTADQIYTELTNLQEAHDMDIQSRDFLTTVLHAGAGFYGAVKGMEPAIKGMAVGKAGANWFLEGGKFMARHPKVAKTLATYGGGALGNAAVFSAAYGRQTDFGSEALHGAVAGLVMMAAGQLGHKTTERLLKSRKNMPKRLAQGIGGAVEGLGFTVPHVVQNGVWEFLKNPSQDSLAHLMVNVLGMAILKGGARRTPMERLLKLHEPMAQRVEARRIVAEKGGEGPVPGTAPQMRQLGELQMRIRKTGDMGEKLRLERERERVEEELDIIERGPVEVSRREDEVFLPKTMEEGLGSRTKEWALAATEEGIHHESETLARMAGRPGVDPVVVPFRSGKVSPGAEGLYRHMENVIRTKGARDLITSAHEWAHAAHRVIFGDVKPGRRSKKIQVTPIKGEKYFEAMAEWSKDFTQREWSEIDKVLEGYDPTHLVTQEARVAEALAETLSRLMMGDARIQLEAPMLTDKVDLLLRKHGPVLEQFNRIKESFEHAEAVGAEGRFEGAVFGSRRREEKIWAPHTGSKIKRIWTTFKRHIYDDLADVRASRDKWLEASGMKAGDFDVSADPARMKDLVRGTSGVIARHILEHEVVGPWGTKKGVKTFRQILNDAKEAGISDRQLMGYVAGMRAIELAGKGIETGINVRDARYWMRKNFATKERRFAAREFGRQLKQFTDAMVDYYAEAGGLTPEEATKIKASNTFYVPFYRIITGAPRAHAGGRGAQDLPKMARLRGGTEQIQDPMRSMYDMVHQVVLKSQQVKVHKALLNFAFASKGEGGAGGFASIVPKTRIPNEIKASEVLDKMLEKVTTEEEFDLIEALMETDVSNEVVKMFGSKLFPHGERSIVQTRGVWSEHDLNMLERVYGTEAADMARKYNGKSIWLEMDSRAYEGLMLGDIYTAFKSGWHKVFTVPARVLRGAATGINPLFALRNTLRDMAVKPVFSEHGYAAMLGHTPFGMLGGVADWMAGVWQASRFSKKPGRDILKSLGIEMGSFYMEGDIERVYAAGSEGTPVSNIKKILEVAGDILGAPGRYSERALRVKEINDVYEKAKAEGASDIEATMQAAEAGRNVTVNFAKGGSTIRIFNQLTPYMKAGAVGQAKMFDSIFNSPTGFSRAIMSITVPSLVLHALNKDEQWYQDLPGWRRLGFWNFQIGDTVLSLPKPFELGTLFASIPEMLWDTAEGRTPQFVEAKEAAWQVLFPYLSEGLETFIPAGAKPLLEAKFNWSAFKDRPLTPSYLQGLPPEQQRQAWTTDFLGLSSLYMALPKSVRTMVGIDNPMEFEHVMNGYLAGWPSRISNAATDFQKFEASVPMSRFPLFYATHQHSATVDKFYETLGEMRQMKRGGLLSGGQLQELRRLEGTSKMMTQIRHRYPDDTEKRNRLLFEAAMKAMR